MSQIPNPELVGAPVVVRNADTALVASLISLAMVCPKNRHYLRIVHSEKLDATDLALIARMGEGWVSFSHLAPD